MTNIRIKKNHHKGHLLSIDLESWIFSYKINAKKLSLKELKQLDNGYTTKALKDLLEILKKYDQKVTFFVVSKLEEIYPGIIEKILAEGHEVGWHTHTHPILVRFDNPTEEFERELELGSKIIQKYNMKGFQAPAVYFLKDWYKLLKSYGFTYSSSVYGNSNKIYDFHGVGEIPISTNKENYSPTSKQIVFPVNLTPSNIYRHGIPFGSSFFWGLLRKDFYNKKLREAKEKGKVTNLFIHEWQLYPPNSQEYKEDVGFLWNPLFMPYKIPVLDMFEHLLANHQFQPIINHIKNNEKK
jgi:peptidoglycan/xylan/chitin deacetylase (PgdA/CDA1 family)